MSKATDLLQQLIATTSFSREEEKTAAVIKKFFEENGVACEQSGNNIWAKNKHFDVQKPTILLNSHHDTVKPNTGYTRDPFTPAIEGGKLYGLGSNDAGGPLVALIATFLHFHDMENLKYNLLIAATAEEEISGKNGIESLLPALGDVNFAIVGEPTSMQPAIAEKGLLVLDCVVHGRSGHAARNEGENALYKALPDIDWFRTYQFPKASDSLGPIHMNVTIINAGTQHNVVPDQCTFTVDIRTTDAYTLEETLTIIKENVNCTVTPRSVRLRPSGIAKYHPIVQAALALGMTPYGSPTLSDQALMPFDSIKLGPGESARSHSADEYIEIQEIETGIITYIQLLEKTLL